MAENLQRMLDDLKQQLLLPSGHVEEGAAKVVTALINRDVRLAESVVLGDGEIDRLEIKIETECEKIFVLQGAASTAQVIDDEPEGEEADEPGSSGPYITY